MKNLLVTGGCGFIGSNFINYMLDTYNDIAIVNVDKLDYCSDINNVYHKERYKLVVTDINNSYNLNNILESHNIDSVVHFAAQSHVDNSFGNSIQFTRDNVMGTHTLLECCRVYGKIEKFVHISTDEVYGEVDTEHKGCNEKSLLNPTNPYAATKAAAEFLVRSYYHSFKLPVVITRGNNVYGPRQFPEKLIPRFISNLLIGKKCPIHGEGKTRRNFIYVDDVSKAVDTILRKGEINEIYNIGSDDEFSVLEVLKTLLEEMGIKEPIEEVCEYVEDRAFNDFRYCIDSSKLELLGWKKTVSFKEGINKTILWYKQNS
uniref:NAD(P)-binding domain-containing protein n=1 Tax=viral metagenome TaxID=1070528 RepID=A0A6C0DKQ6_9ZZZZ